LHSVVVLDDNKITVQAIVQSVNWQSLDCYVAGEGYNGVEGMELLEKLTPDIVITDIRMPGYSGLEMMEKMMEKNLNSKYIIISGFGEFEYAQQALKLGASDYLLKPIMTGDLEKALRKVIEKIKSSPEEEDSENEDELDRKIKEIRQATAGYSVLIRNALIYIDNHINETISLSGIAEEFSVSASHFSKCFKRETGVGFSNYFTMVKMRKAKTLLHNSQNRVYEVANMLGYHDYTYFFQVFKKQYGYSPSDEKQNTQNKTRRNEE